MSTSPAACMLFSSLVLPCALGAGEAARPDASAWPQWRKAMTEANTIYDISDNTLRGLKFDFPGGVIPAQFSNNDGEAGTGGTIFGYGGGTLLCGVGKFGVLAFGSGGENFLGNMTGALNLNGDRAVYEVWQQPIFATKPGPGVEFYWDPAGAAALPENRRIAHQRFDKAANWDGQFPMAIGNWIYPAPMRYLEVADQVPYGQYRYDQHCYIPADHTGLKTGVWFIPSACFTAPGFYYGPDRKVMADFWPSGAKKFYAHYQREDSKAWTRLAEPVPEQVGAGSFSSQVVGFSTKHRKVVVPKHGAHDEFIGICDISQGLAKATWSVQRWVGKGNGKHQLRCGNKSVMTNGHPRNRALFLWYNGPISVQPEGLSILDLDDPTFPVHAIKLPLKGTGERLGLHYLPATNTVISFGVAGDALYYQKITIPDKLDDLAAYKVEDVPLTAAPGVNMATAYTNAGMVQYVEKLDCIVFLAVNTPAKAFFVK